MGLPLRKHKTKLLLRNSSLEGIDDALRHLNLVHYGESQVPLDVSATDEHKAAHHRLQMARQAELTVIVEKDGSFTPVDLMIEGKKYKTVPV